MYKKGGSENDRGGHLRRLCTVHPGQDGLGQSRRIHLHRLTPSRGAAAGSDRDLGQRIAGLVPFLGQSSDDADGGIMLIERGAQLLSGLRQGLSQGVGLQGERIPFLLEDAQQGGDGGQRGRSGSDDTLGLDLDQVLGGELLSVHGILAILGDVGLDQSLLKDAAYFSQVSVHSIHLSLSLSLGGDLTALGGDDGLLGGLSGNYKTSKISKRLTINPRTNLLAHNIVLQGGN